MKNKLVVIAVLVLLVMRSIAQSVNYSDSTIVMPASNKYKAQAIGKFILGNHYRDVWSAPIQIKYLDLAHSYGGLSPIKKGGGFQTKSLRLLSADSSQYVIRTIDKDPSKTVSEIFEGTIVTDLIQDQISASHPYAFLVVPPLAIAANIYHTNPKVLYVPDDPLLGIYKDEFKHNMVLFEERLLSNASVEEGLSGFRKVKDTWEVLEAIHKSSGNMIDQRFAMRSRLFDMLIGDWDRHEDQWLWAQYNLDNGDKLFKPIPRDRDQAFFDFDGLLPTIASLNVATTRKMQRFKAMPVSTQWFNFNARNFDHNFLNQMTRSDWVQMADSLILLVSDAEIENAFKVLPDTVYKLSAQQLITTLKARRNNLPIIANQYYNFLARKCLIVGTEKQDLFEIIRSEKNKTEISVYQYKDQVKGKQTYYRKFLYNETKEIQLYGLDGNDYFTVSGKSSTAPKLRIVGGGGEDTVVDHSKVLGPGNRTYYYDSGSGNYLAPGKEVSDRTSADTILNSYTIKNIDYNFQGVYPLLGYNVDDGLFIGATTSRITYGFKKGPCSETEPCYNSAPYATKQSLSMEVALNTGAFNFRYKGDFSDVFGKLDLNISAVILAPNNNLNFFGYGNETKIADTLMAEDYRIRTNQITIFPALEAGNEDKIRFLFGPIYQQASVSDDTTGDFFSIFPDLNPDNLSRKHYIGANTQFTFDPFTPKLRPVFSYRFVANTGYLKQIEDNTVHTAFFRGYVSFYYSIYRKTGKTPLLTIATRIGGGYNAGEYEFYQANIIGGRSYENVRGFRGERFSGRTALYNNFELRLRLLHFKAYVLPADLGIIGLLDNGRVWNEDENSQKIHTAYGGGIFLSPFSLATISATYAFSHDEPAGLMNIKLGWWF